MGSVFNGIIPSHVHDLPPPHAQTCSTGPSRPKTTRTCFARTYFLNFMVNLCGQLNFNNGKPHRGHFSRPIRHIMHSLRTSILLTHYLQAQAGMLPKSRLLNPLTLSQAGQILDYYSLFTKWNKVIAVAQGKGAIAYRVAVLGSQWVG
jgi:hypothetical protein